MRSALFFDIDGTILSAITKKIPESTISALLQAKENGHLLFVNSGRTAPSLPDEIRQFPFDGYLCGCGSYLVFHDEVVLESHIEKERGQAIIRKMKECCMEGILEGSKDIRFPRDITRFELLEGNRRHFTGRGLGTKGAVEDGDFIYDKMFVYADEQSDTETFFQFVSRDMTVMEAKPGAYEIIQKKFSKATACEIILKKLGMSLDQAYMFGDSSNDIAMFRYGTHNILMGEHAEELEPYAEFVTKKVEEDGIWYALKHYGFI